MQQTILVISLLYILFIIYIYLVYNHEKKPKESYTIWREKLDIEPVLAAYLIDKDYEWENLILADVLELVNEGYVRNRKGRR